jgi:dGTPase
MTAAELPADAIAVLGDSGSARIDTLVHDLVEHSAAAGAIVQGPVAGPAMGQLREFMFERVYLGPVAQREHAKIATVLRTLFEHYVAEPEALPDDGGAPDADLGQRVVDYIAGMTDRYCMRAFERLTIPAAVSRDGDRVEASPGRLGGAPAQPGASSFETEV